MRRTSIGFALLLVTTVNARCQPQPSPTPAPVPAPALTPAPTAAPAPALTQLPAASPQPLSPTQETNNAFMKQWLGRIVGRENEPAEKVFKNIRIPWLKATPAERFLRIMNAGYARALGVACTHCHVETDFPSDDKRPKRAARDMADMHHGINEQLAKMQNLNPEKKQRFINCSTCHRGQVDPTAGQ